MGDRGPANLESQRQLGLASAQLDAGQLTSVRDRIATVLKSPEAQVDGPLRAQSLWLLARHDAKVGRWRRAIQAAQAAIPIFQSSGDLASEAAALCLLAHAHSGLGRDGEAVEAGLLCVRLGHLLPPGPNQSRQFNALGVAYLWGRSFTAAEAALGEAEQLARSCGLAGGRVPPLVNLGWLEAMRLVEARSFTGRLTDLAALEQRLQQCSEALAANPRPQAAGQASARCASALLKSWQGRVGAAAEQLLLARCDAERVGGVHLVHFCIRWAQAELDWARGDLDAALAEAAALVDAAGRAEFEPLVGVGHALCVQLHKSRGRHDLALEAEQQRRRRELRIQTEGLDGRNRAVQAHLEVRASRHHLQWLSERSRELERLAFEDALTGIANRRSFEQRLNSLLGQCRIQQAPFCLALIDLDDFKLVNDRHSHPAGDEVLKSVALAIRDVVRQTDLPARLGGDEFVVLFPHTALATAEQVCQRISATLGALRWGHLSPALAVSASIGVTQALPGDSPQSILQRSDAGMFHAKERGGVLAS